MREAVESGGGGSRASQRDDNSAVKFRFLALYRAKRRIRICFSICQRIRLGLSQYSTGKYVGREKYERDPRVCTRTRAGDDQRVPRGKRTRMDPKVEAEREKMFQLE